MTDCDEDSDFIESDHDFESEEDDNERDRKKQQEEDNDNDLDELELPSSKEIISQYSSDKDGSYHFSEFTFDGNNIKPVGTNFDREANERTPQRASSNNNANNAGNEQTFHFISTLMLSREALSAGLNSGPAVTFYTQLVLVHVPADDVNFEDVVDHLIDMGEADIAGVRAPRAEKRRCTD
ncbi:Hypothetical predicted protein [Olea europaea subsp. europaea]|uniref:Uncharacterized protein n=1 Tax=Olea europaea subsp. europaea TaxID=158383 RepID=A0A8S0PVW1_OLEEU|nr:Hypothetical predicted protein [Olea europaea subsp. europaea]